MPNNNSILPLFVFLLSLSQSFSHRHFLIRFPNFDKVPGNCDLSEDQGGFPKNGNCLCEAFGHSSCTYPDEISKFGDEFHDIGKKYWNRQFCMMDSDGDGKTNGDELGDPCCEWSVGQVPRRSNDISHPGNFNSVTSQPSCKLSGDPLAPSDFKVEHTSNGSARLSWVIGDTCVCYYQILLQNEKNEVIMNLSYVAHNQNPYTVCDLPRVTTTSSFTVTVNAVNLVGKSESKFTMVLSATDPTSEFSCSLKAQQTFTATSLLSQSIVSSVIPLIFAVVFFGSLVTLGLLIKLRQKNNNDKLRAIFHHKHFPPLQNSILGYFLDSIASFSITQLLLVIFTFVVLCVFYYYWYVRLTVTERYMYAENSGWIRAVGDLCMPLLGLVLLPVTKRSIFGYLFGSSYERLLVFHRWVARLLIFCCTVHALGILYSSSFGIFYLLRWSQTQKGSPNLPATIAWVCMLLIAFTSFAFMRRHFFSLFFYVHFLTGIVVIGLLLHHPPAVYYCIPGIVLYAFDFIGGLVDAFWRKSTVISAKLIKDSFGAASYIELKICKEHFTFEPGQYVFLTIPSLGLIPHPFSICSHPSDVVQDDISSSLSIHDEEFEDDDQGNVLTTNRVASGPFGYQSGSSTFMLCMKNTGHGSFTDKLSTLISFSDQLVEAEDDHVRRSHALGVQDLASSSVYITGPFGNPSVQLYSYKWIILFAGGIGITPIVPIWKELKQIHQRHQFHQSKVILCWSFRSLQLFDEFKHALGAQSDPASSSSSSSSPPYAISSSPSSSSSFSSLSSAGSTGSGSTSFGPVSSLEERQGDHELHNVSLASSKDKRDRENSIFETLFYHTGRSSGDSNNASGLQMNHGRPDINTLIFDLSSEADSNVGVFVCGPPSFSGDVERACYRVNSVMNFIQFHVHSESFNL